MRAIRVQSSFKFFQCFLFKKGQPGVSHFGAPDIQNSIFSTEFFRLFRPSHHQSFNHISPETHLDETDHRELATRLLCHGVSASAIGAGRSSPRA